MVATVTLQFGHGPLAVDHPETEPFVFDPDVNELQFGHGPLAVDHAANPMFHPDALPELQFGHGPLAVDHLHLGVRLVERTTGFNSATARWPWITRCSRHSGRANCELQFGHGPLAVDHSWSGRRGRGGRCCFNSATARWPWITSLVFRGQGRDAVASIRPRPAGRGSRGRVTACWACQCRFNSATARWPWIT